MGGGHIEISLRPAERTSPKNREPEPKTEPARYISPNPRLRHSAPEAHLTIELRCSCGQVYHADPAHAGRSIRCRCGRTLPIPAPAPPPGPGPNSAAAPDSAPRVRIRKRRRSRTGSKATGAKLSRLLPIPAWLPRSLPTLVWAWLATIVAAAAFMWIFGDAWWPASVVLFGPRWLLLIPVLPLALGALLVRPRLLLPTALGLIITLGPVMGLRTGWRRWLSSPPPRTLRIITFNVASPTNPRFIDAPLVLAAYNSDIMVFQECSRDLTQPEFWPPEWTAHFAEGNICFGTRFPVVESKALKRVLTGDQGGTGNAALFRLLVGGDTIAVAGIHLETPRKGLESLRYAGNASRMPVNILIRDVGARRVSRWIREEATNPIIAGDFNMPVESRIYREYFGDCTNAFSAIGTGFGWTRVLRRFSARIDHILTCGGWRPLHIEIGPAIGSDHRPVIVDLARTR